MKKAVLLVMFILSLCANGCIDNSETDKNSSSNFNNNKIEDNTNLRGDYLKQKIFNKIIEIENCKDPNQLAALLKNIYGKNINIEGLSPALEPYNASMTNKGSNIKNYFEYALCGFIDLSKEKNIPQVSNFRILNSNGSKFYIKGFDVPIFVMDEYGTYLCTGFDILQEHGSEGNYIQQGKRGVPLLVYNNLTYDKKSDHTINMGLLNIKRFYLYRPSELYLALHGYIKPRYDGEDEDLKNTVLQMKNYMEFENSLKNFL